VSLPRRKTPLSSAPLRHRAARRDGSARPSPSRNTTHHPDEEKQSSHGGRNQPSVDIHRPPKASARWPPPTKQRPASVSTHSAPEPRAGPKSR
jgi:hypothetical protein